MAAWADGELIAEGAMRTHDVADLPDDPCWVDARWLVTSGIADVVACASGAVAVGRTLPLGAVFARPRPGVLRAVAESEKLYRRRGYAAATFEALAAHMAGTGRRPVWGAGEHTTISLRLAARLGFRPYGRVAVLAPPVAGEGQPAGARAPGGAVPKGGPLVGYDADA